MSAQRVTKQKRATRSGAPSPATRNITTILVAVDKDLIDLAVNTARERLMVPSTITREELKACLLEHGESKVTIPQDWEPSGLETSIFIGIEDFKESFCDTEGYTLSQYPGARSR